MKRREFIVGLGGAVAVWPLAARAQQPDRMRRVAVLISGAENDPEVRARYAAFKQELEQLGWVEGRDIRIDHRFASGRPDQYERIARELVGQSPEVIFAHTTPIALAL